MTCASAAHGLMICSAGDSRIAGFLKPANRLDDVFDAADQIGSEMPHASTSEEVPRRSAARTAAAAMSSEKFIVLP
jgi:hypothetical protein